LSVFFFRFKATDEKIDRHEVTLILPLMIQSRGSSEKGWKA